MASSQESIAQRDPWSRAILSMGLSSIKCSSRLKMTFCGHNHTKTTITWPLSYRRVILTSGSKTAVIQSSNRISKGSPSSKSIITSVPRLRPPLLRPLIATFPRLARLSQEWAPTRARSARHRHRAFHGRSIRTRPDCTMRYHRGLRIM